MDKWLEAYGSWPPINQMIFSIIVLLFSVVLLFLFGLWLFQIFGQISVWLHGWPDETRKGSAPPVAGRDWQEEQTHLAAEAKFHKEQDAERQQPMT